MAEKKQLKFDTLEDALKNYEDETLWINDAMEICKGKVREDGSQGEKYIKVKKTIVLEKDQILTLRSRKEVLEERLAKGFLTQEQFDKQIMQADWVTHLISVPARKKKSK